MTPTIATVTLANPFFQAMSESDANSMRQRIDAMGPVRLSEVEGAEAAIVGTAVAMAGEIVIALDGGVDALVFRRTRYREWKSR